LVGVGRGNVGEVCRRAGALLGRLRRASELLVDGKIEGELRVGGRIATDRTETSTATVEMEAGLIEGWNRGGDDELELEEVMPRRHGRAGELLAARVDDDVFRDRTDGVPTTTTSACCLDTEKRMGEF
jgi:hypothetical protein